MKSLNHYFPEFGTGCVAKVAYQKNHQIYIDTLVEGYAQVKPNFIPMEEDCLFDIASLTKTFTAILIHKAIERNLCSFNDKVCDIDERFIHLENVTITDLLMHATDIWTDGYLGNAKSKLEFYTILFSAYVKENSRRYVDVHYMILSVLLEKIYGISYREIVIRDIIDPLHLKHTKFEVNVSDKLASCNYQVIDGKEIHNIINVPHDTKARVAHHFGFTVGHAGIFTTAEDLFQILLCFIDHKEVLLKQTTIDNMLKHGDYGAYLNTSILTYAKEHSIPMIRTSDIHLLLQHLLSQIENPDDFLDSIVKPYNLAGMRYQNPYSEILTIPFDTSSHTVIFSGYTGPVYLIDLEKKIIILVMTNVCHASKKERKERLYAIIHMVKDLYEDTKKKIFCDLGKK